MLYSSPDICHLQALVASAGKSTEHQQLQIALKAHSVLNTDPSFSEHNNIILEPNSTDIPG